ncbi:MAG: hypothetical protein JRI96_00620 [Deltaproteobacteria bacterium]|nr:hypothetical protein [Deltaproteobacteria bacterium]
MLSEKTVQFFLSKAQGSLRPDTISSPKVDRPEKFGAEEVDFRIDEILKYEK